MSYRLINANALTFNSDGFITQDRILNEPCIYADLPSGMDGEHYVLEQEPTPKENLVVENRQFEELVVEYPPSDLCTYPEYRGKPYFAIKYTENGEHIIGYGTYKPEVISRYIKDYFLRSVQIKPRTGHWINNAPQYDMLNQQYICSECGNAHIRTTPFCEMCGSRMEVEDAVRN